MPDIDMVDDAYWLKFAKDRVTNAIAARDAAAEKLDNFLGIVWGIYTTVLAVTTFFGLPDTTTLESSLMALPVIVLPIARLFCMAVLLPVNVEFPVNVIELIRDNGYVAVLEAKKARMVWAICATILSVVSIALALFVFKTGILGKEAAPRQAHFIKATYRPACRDIWIEGLADSAKPVKLTVIGKDTAAKKWVFQEITSYVARYDGRIDTLIPTGAHADFRIFAAWTDGTKTLRIIRN